MDMVYFDNSATTKPYGEVIDEVQECMERYFGNPSSAHRLGLESERKIKSARERVAKLIGSSPQEIVFTSGGSEANNTAIKGIITKGDHIITSKIEHPSVLYTLEALEEEGYDVTYLDVDSRGLISIEDLKKSIRANTKLVTIMYVNNEIGSIEPVNDIVKTVREKNKKTKVHIDAVQSLGKIKIDVKKLDVDLMSLSSHKIHGPKGVGALYIKKGLVMRSLITGGGQEMDVRSGTENLPGISGFGMAADITAVKLEKDRNSIYCLKKHFIERLDEIDKIVVNSPQDDFHIDNILNISFEGIRGEVLLHALEDFNIFVSTGSACSAKKSSHKNYVLPSIGLKPCYIEGAIRFSFSYGNTLEEVDFTIEALKKTIPFLRRSKR